MVQILLIAVFVVMFLRDGLNGGPLLGRHDHAQVAALTVGSMAALWLVSHLLVWHQARRMDRGRVGAVRRADIIQAGTRAAAVVLHAYLIIGLGWLDAVRSRVGDLVLGDEVLAALPVLGVFVMGWWSMYAVDHRLREAVLLHDLDQGRPVREMPSRLSYMLAALRHQAALVLIPVLSLLAWNEFLERSGDRLPIP